MAPPHNRNARRQPGVGGSGSANLTSWEQSDSELLRIAQGSLAPAAKRLLADLEIIAEWREDLTSRMARAQLVLETIGLSREQHDALIHECEAFKRLCRVLADSLPGSLVEAAADHEEREAA
jgi:hypothetical protein